MFSLPLFTPMSTSTTDQMPLPTAPIAVSPVKPLTLRKRVANLVKAHETAIKGEFTMAVQTLFTTYPRLKQIEWDAGSEYNDGDGTSFSSNHEEPQINGFDGYDGADDPDANDLLSLADKGDKDAKAAVEAVGDLMAAFPDSFYESYFGSGGVLKKGRKPKWTEQDYEY